jgi:DNA topoisomerase-3
LTCPKCKNVTIKKGKTAYGCANFGTCGFKIPFGLLNKKLTDKQVVDLIQSGKTAKIKGLEMPGSEKSFEGRFVLTADFEIEIEK